MPSPKFQEVDVLKGDDGVVAVITRRDRPSQPAIYSFALLKEYEKSGETRRSSFLHKRHTSSALALLHTVETRIDELEDKDRARLRAG